MEFVTTPDLQDGHLSLSSKNNISNQMDLKSKKENTSACKNKICDTPTNTLNGDIEAPLSPVLSNSKHSVKYIARRKSRIKLLNKFSQNSGISQQIVPLSNKLTDKIDRSENKSPKTTIDSNRCDSPEVVINKNNTEIIPIQGTSNDSLNSSSIEERMKQIKQIKMSKKFNYNIKAPPVLPPINETVSSDKLDISSASNTPSISSKSVFKTPTNRFTLKNCNKTTSNEVNNTNKCETLHDSKNILSFEPNFSMDIGFSTGSGKKVQLSERALKRALKIFDDIIEMPYKSSDMPQNEQSTSATFNNNTKNVLHSTTALVEANSSIASTSRDSKNEKIVPHLNNTDSFNEVLPGICLSESEKHKIESDNISDSTDVTESATKLAFDERKSLEFPNNNVDFKTANGKNLSLSDESLKKVVNLFDDVFDLSDSFGETENCGSSNLLPILLSSNTKIDGENCTNNIYEETNLTTAKTSVQNSSKINRDLPPEITPNKDKDTCFKIPILPAQNKSISASVSCKSNEEYSLESKYMFSQISDTQMCWVTENAECMMKMMDSQWTLSPQEKTKKTQEKDTNALLPIDLERNNTETDIAKTENDFDDFTTQETDMFFGNITICTDGTVACRNTISQEKNEDSQRSNESLEEDFVGFNTQDVSASQVNQEKSRRSINLTFDGHLNELRPEETVISQNIIQTSQRNDLHFDEDFLGFDCDSETKALQRSELYKRVIKFIERDLKKGDFYPISFTFDDVQQSVDFRNKNLRYSLRTTRKSPVTCVPNKRTHARDREKSNKRSKTSSQEDNISKNTNLVKCLPSINNNVYAKSSSEGFQKIEIVLNKLNTFEEESSLKDSLKDSNVSNNTSNSYSTPNMKINIDFSSASGKKVIASEDSLKKVQNLFSDCDSDLSVYETPISKSKLEFSAGSCKSFETLEKRLSLSHQNSSVYVTPTQNFNLENEKLEVIQNKNDMFEENYCKAQKNSANLELTTASEKKVNLTEESLRNAKTLFEGCDKFSDEQNKNCDTPKNYINFGGFATASGRKVKISEESLNKVKNLFEGCEDISDDQNRTYETPKCNTNLGFAKASGKKVNISEESLKKVRNIFEDCDDLFNEQIKSYETPKSNTNIGCFATASGKKVSFTEESLKKARNIFEGCDDLSDGQIKQYETPKCNTNIGCFATASGRKVSFTEESLKKAKNIFEGCDDLSDERNKKLETPINKNSLGGFATAVGKKVNISDESLKKAKKMFEACDDFSDEQNKKCKTSKNNSSNGGFATASGKKVNISEESLKKVKNIFEGCEDISEDQNKKCKCETPKNNFSITGFATASGKKVNISEESLKKAKNIFEECVDLSDEPNNLHEIPKSYTSISEFATVPEKKVKISDESLKKTENIFEGCQDISDELGKKCETPENNNNLGFATASGRKVNINEEYLKKVKNLFEDCDDFFDFQETPQSNTCVGFATASGKKVNISEESLNKAKTIFEDSSFASNDNANDITAHNQDDALNESLSKTKSKVIDDQSCETPKKLLGFATASGKNVEISDESLHKTRNIFDDCENVEDVSQKLQSNSGEISDKNVADLKDECIIQQYQSPLIQRNKSVLSPQISCNNSTPVLKNRSIGPKGSKKRSLGVSSCRQIDIPETSLKKAKLVFDEIDTPKKNLALNTAEIILSPKTPLKTQHTPTTQKTPMNRPETPQISTPILTQHNSSLINRNVISQNTSISELNYTPNRKISPFASQHGFIQTSNETPLVLKEQTKGDINKWKTDMQKELDSLKLKMSVIETRMQALLKQQEIIESGSSDHRRQQPGHLFTQKTQAKNRISLKHAVRYRRPEKITPQKSLAMGVSQHVLEISPENATQLHFFVPWWPNETRTYPALIRTEDGAIIVPNQQNYVGSTEIEAAFMAMPAVDPTLVAKGWIANHFRWIVWKLASLERNFPDVFKGYLTVENIFSQLKYRYDREIDRAQRPALRKILERDDVPGRRMVLCVASVIKLTEGKFDLELSDGWYSIRTTIDSPLNSLVLRGVVKVGMKLMIHGAELSNCEACSPLETPPDARLQIYYNGTRRAAWDAKLGYQPNPSPLCIGLKTINGYGGPIGSTYVYIARVYPISYMERAGPGPGGGAGAGAWRNARAELRAANQWEARHATLMETLQQQLLQELEQEWKQDKKEKLRSVKVKDVAGISCAKTLFALLEASNDPDSVREILTPSQCHLVQEYQNNLSMQRQEEVTSRLRQKLSNENIPKRNVSSVLKLLLVDVNSIYHHRVFNIWSPKESHIQELKEELAVRIYNFTARNNGTLSSIPRTQFELDLDADTAKFECLERKVTAISQTRSPAFKPLFGEFDTIGMIVNVDVQQSRQTLWLADENARFLLITIREGPQTCCLFDGLIPGKVIAITNLLYQKPSKSYGEALANHYTTVATYPKEYHLQKFMREFIQELPKDIDKYFEDCKDQVEGCIAEMVMKSSFLNIMPFSCETNDLENRLLGVTQKSEKSEALTLSDEEMSMIDTQLM